MAERDYDPEDRWLYARNGTPAELWEMRLTRYMHGQELEAAIQPPLGYYTCDNCALAARCTLAFDSYNTDGDCLMEK